VHLIVYPRIFKECRSEWTMRVSVNCKASLCTIHLFLDWIPILLLNAVPCVPGQLSSDDFFGLLDDKGIAESYVLLESDAATNPRNSIDHQELRVRWGDVTDLTDDEEDHIYYDGPGRHHNEW
jgi:hypothetical protein